MQCQQETQSHRVEMDWDEEGQLASSEVLYVCVYIEHMQSHV